MTIIHRSVVAVLSIVVAIAATAFFVTSETVSETASAEPPHTDAAVVEYVSPLIAQLDAESTPTVVELVEDSVNEVLQVETSVETHTVNNSPPTTTSSSECSGLSAEFGLPERILWRESRCSLDAYNATGCGGRGCIGAAQIDLGHFAEVSPWNSRASGTCSDLDPNSIAHQIECTHRLSGGGSNLSPWGG